MNKALNNIKLKIQSLIAKGENVATTEHEALVFLQKAAELQEKYGVASLELEPEYINDVREYEPKKESKRKRPIPEYYKVTPLIGELFECATLCNEYTLKLTYFGEETNTQLAHYMTNMIFNTLKAEFERYKKTPAYKADKASWQSKKTDFYHASVFQLALKIKKLIDAKNQTFTSNQGDGTSLTVSETPYQKVFNASLAINQAKRRSFTSHGCVTSESGKAGRSAGKSIDINKKGVANEAQRASRRQICNG